jgi:Fe2+ transport system protein FeoA
LTGSSGGRSGPGTDPAERPLDRLAPGDSGVIVRLTGDPATARRLMELGLVPGSEVQVVRRAPLGDPIEYRIRDVHLSLRRVEAANVHVAPR